MLRVPTEINFGRRFFGERESRYRRSRLHGHLHRRLRNRSVSNMADLAMLLVVGVGVPVADRVRGQQTQREDERDCQANVLLFVSYMPNSSKMLTLASWQ